MRVLVTGLRNEILHHYMGMTEETGVVQISKFTQNY